MTKVEHIAFLLYKELEGKLPEAESRELESWRLENPEHTSFVEELMEEENFAAMIGRYHPENKETVKEKIMKKMEGQLNFKVVPLYRRSFFRIAVAACIGALIIAGGYFIFFNDKKGTETPPIAKTNDIQAPKENKAVIKLPDGKEILIDSLTTYSQGNVTVTKMADGRLVYSGLGSEVVFNTITNPRGSKVIDMTLADGSHIWLNAGSSITYPVAFTGNERKVSMTGEGYFEIAHNAGMPFTVSKNDLNVTVLGTKFNVNAYDDEPGIKVTLLEGSVRVNRAADSKTIKPGQQAIATPGSELRIQNSVDLEQVMAWKNGKFKFTNTDLKVIMREIGRWYDVEVIYEGNIPVQPYELGIPRTVNVSEVLKGLDYTGAHFSVEGKKIIVRP